MLVAIAAIVAHTARETPDLKPAVSTRRVFCVAPISLQSSRRTTPSLALRPASRSVLRRLHQRQQFVAVMLELLVADAGDAAKLFKRRRSRRRDAVNR